MHNADDHRAKPRKQDTMKESEEWLAHEDMACKSDRVARLDWLASITPGAEYLTFPAGLTAKYLFEEARYSFVYALCANISETLPTQ